MIAFPSGVRVWLATGHTDMRKGGVSAVLRVQGMAAVKDNELNDAGLSYCRSSLDALRSLRDALAPETKKVRKDF